MKLDSESTRTVLLRRLNDGNFHSGESLGSELGISRSAISKHIRVLIGLGIELFSVKGKGYKLAKTIDMLDANRIVSASKHLTEERLSVTNIITSTNDFIKQRINDVPSGYCCTAEAQTEGRGRHGRTWVSPFGASIYLSMAWKFSGGYQSISGLSLLVGLAIKRTLADFYIKNAKLKWPNDVYIDKKKLAGVLIEVEGQVGGDTRTIIGIGVNLALPNHIKAIDQPFIDVESIIEKTIDRNVFFAKLVDHLYELLLLFEKSGLTNFISEWESSDLYLHKKIQIIAGQKSIVGVCRGINEQGALLLEDTTGSVHPYYGGEVSVRPSR